MIQWMLSCWKMSCLLKVWDLQSSLVFSLDLGLPIISPVSRLLPPVWMNGAPPGWEPSLIHSFLTFLMLIYFWDNARDRVQAAEGQTEGDTESEAGSRLWAVSPEPDAGLELMNCEIVTWAEVGHSIHWAAQASPKRFVKVQTCEDDFIWKQGLCRHN